jgi:hypothetical protein
MNKKYVVGLIALAVLTPVASNAATLSNQTIAGPTIAILDTAIDTSIPSIKDHIIYEACITEFGGCANGSYQVEGTGSATLPYDLISKNGFEHGTEMASVAIQTNANINIVFVKIVGTNPRNGARQAMGEKSVYNALAWVIANKEKFNIQAVAMSQGNHNLLAGANYCPSTPTTEEKINTLKSMNVASFFPSGNSSDYSKIDWPACIPNSIAIGSTLPDSSMAFYSNYDANLVDFFALGSMKATIPGGSQTLIAGTSAANVVAATNWATLKYVKSNLSYNDEYALFSKTSTLIKNSKGFLGKLININGALNG